MTPFNAWRFSCDTAFRDRRSVFGSPVPLSTKSVSGFLGEVSWERAIGQRRRWHKSGEQNGVKVWASVNRLGCKSVCKGPIREEHIKPRGANAQGRKARLTRPWPLASEQSATIGLSQVCAKRQVAYGRPRRPAATSKTRRPGLLFPFDESAITRPRTDRHGSGQLEAANEAQVKTEPQVDEGLADIRDQSNHCQGSTHISVEKREVSERVNLVPAAASASGTSRMLQDVPYLQAAKGCRSITPSGARTE